MWGMFRTREEEPSQQSGLPHASGDVPDDQIPVQYCLPHASGDVPVGEITRYDYTWSSHACGDVPIPFLTHSR